MSNNNEWTPGTENIKPANLPPALRDAFEAAEPAGESAEWLDHAEEHIDVGVTATAGKYLEARQHLANVEETLENAKRILEGFEQLLLEEMGAGGHARIAYQDSLLTPVETTHVSVLAEHRAAVLDYLQRVGATELLDQGPRIKSPTLSKHVRDAMADGDDLDDELSSKLSIFTKTTIIVKAG